MKLIVDRQELDEVLAVAVSVAPTHSPKLVLKNVSLVALNETLLLEAFNGEVAIKVSVRKVEIEKEGRVLVNARQLYEFIRNLDDERVQLNLHQEKSKFAVSASGAVRKFNCGDFDDWSSLPNIDAASVELKTEILQAMWSRVAFASAREKSRFAMDGVCIRFEDKVFSAIGTDGRRLAIAEKTIELESDEFHCVIPSKAIATIQRLISAGDEWLTIAMNDSYVRIQFGTVEVLARLVVGHFPPYQQVIPKNHKHELTLDRLQLASRLKLAAQATTKESASVRFSFEPGKLNLRSRTVDRGEPHATIPIDFDADLLIGLNPLFFNEALRAYSSDEIVLTLGDAKSAAVIEEQAVEGLEGLRSRCIIMPVNLGEEK